MSRLNLETLLDFMQRKEKRDKGGRGTGEIERAEHRKMIRRGNR